MKVCLFNAGIFQSERLTVVLSRMDTYYTQESSEHSHPDQMKKIVAENVEKAVKLKVSPELVYPVSGLWAVNVSEYSVSCHHGRTFDNGHFKRCVSS